jgi:hypothetical protein
MRKSVWRLCVDMQAIVSALYAHAGHELRLLRWVMNRSKPGNRGFKINQSAAFSTFLVDAWQFARADRRSFILHSVVQ